MTETQNVATYARIRPYNPAINEDTRLTARCKDGDKILNQNGNNEDTYNFTRVFDMGDDTNKLFTDGIQPLLDYKILQGINSIFIVYGQSGSGKSFTLIGEHGHLGVLPMSLQYLLNKDIVENIKIASIEAYGIKSTKICFYDLVAQLQLSQKSNGSFDAYKSQDNPRLNSTNAQMIEITHENCLEIITKLQAVSHMAPTLKNPHSSRGHTVYFCRVKMVELEPVYFIAVDLAGSEGQTALGTKDEFVEGLKLAISKGKLTLSSKQMKGFEDMYKIRSLEAGCINNGLTQLQSIFGELIKKKISKSQGLGLRKVLSSFISLNSAYAILFTLSASANNNKVTRATLNFAKQTQLVKVDTKRAKKKIDKDKVIKELNELIEELRKEMKQKDKIIKDMEKNGGSAAAAAGGAGAGADGKEAGADGAESDAKTEENGAETSEAEKSAEEEVDKKHDVFAKFDMLNRDLAEAEEEEAMWTVKIDKNMNVVGVGAKISEDEMKRVFDEFDSDGSGQIDDEELYSALKSMGQDLPPDQIASLVREIDVNGDGQVDFDEFRVLFEQSWFISAHENAMAESMKKMMQSMESMEEFNLLSPVLPSTPIPGTPNNERSPGPSGLNIQSSVTPDEKDYDTDSDAMIMSGKLNVSGRSSKEKDVIIAKLQDEMKKLREEHEKDLLSQSKPVGGTASPVGQGNQDSIADKAKLAQLEQMDKQKDAMITKLKQQLEGLKQTHAQDILLLNEERKKSSKSSKDGNAAATAAAQDGVIQGLQQEIEKLRKEYNDQEKELVRVRNDAAAVAAAARTQTGNENESGGGMFGVGAGASESGVESVLTSLRSGDASGATGATMRLIRNGKNRNNYAQEIGQAVFFMFVGATVAYVVPKYLGVGMPEEETNVPGIMFRIWDKKPRL